MSISLEHLPIPTGNAFFSWYFALATLIVVDLARYGCSRGEQASAVASRAAPFAFWPSSNSPCAGTHELTTRLPLLSAYELWLVKRQQRRLITREYGDLR